MNAGQSLSRLSYALLLSLGLSFFPLPVALAGAYGGFKGSKTDLSSGYFYYNLGYIQSSFYPDYPGSFSANEEFGGGHPDASAFSTSGSLFNNGTVEGGTQYETHPQSVFAGGQHAFGPATCTPALVVSGVVYNGTSFPDFTPGTTMAAAYSVNPDGTFKALPGATIHFTEHPPYQGLDYRPYEQSFVTTLRTLNGHPAAYACFGRPESALIPPDGPYPAGMANASYYFSASLAGYHTLTSSANVHGAAGSDPTGSEWVGKGCALIMSPDSSPDPGSAVLGQNLDSGSGPITPTSGTGGTGGTGGTTGGGDTGSFGDFFTTFWDKLKAFFTLDTADLDALKASASRLSTYGPLGVPAGIVTEVNSAFGSTNTSLDPTLTGSNYWVLQLSNVTLENSTASLPAVPAGYDPSVGRPPDHAPTIYDRMFPTQVDLLPYASFLLRGRRLALAAIWLLVAFGLVSRFTPSLKV